MAYMCDVGSKAQLVLHHCAFRDPSHAGLFGFAGVELLVFSDVLRSMLMETLKRNMKMQHLKLDCCALADL